MDVRRILDQIINSSADNINLIQDLMVDMTKNRTKLYEMLDETEKYTPLVKALDNRLNAQIGILQSAIDNISNAIESITSIRNKYK